ncbi:translation initiation factor eIF-2B subunit alpha [Sergentomyia squamirostris]
MKDLSSFDVEHYFVQEMEKDQNLSAGIAAIKTLLMVLEKTPFDTVQELHSTLKLAIETMRKTEQPLTAVISGCELFSRFITLAKIDDITMEECKTIMLHRGNVFLQKLLEARQIIAKRAALFLQDKCRVLTHSRSRVVLEAIIVAAQSNKRFHVFITRSSDNAGEQMKAELEKCGIECTLILDSAIGYIMENVDMVLVGAEGVVESGGIINRIGTLTMALCAKEMNKPFYVLAESFKFSRLYPLNQRDLPDEYKYPRKDLSSDLTKTHPLVDYTPPGYITLLFTDLGVLTPSAVSDELVKLYL